MTDELPLSHEEAKDDAFGFAFKAARESGVASVVIACTRGESCEHYPPLRCPRNPSGEEFCCPFQRQTFCFPNGERISVEGSA